MRWSIENLHIHVEGTDEEKAWLREYLVFKDTSFRPGRSWNSEDRNIRLYNLIMDTFPAGFGSTTFKAAKEAGFQVEVHDARIKPCPPNPNADLNWLRHHPSANVSEITHQIEAVEAVFKRNRGIIKVPTGGGKTEIACGLAKALPCRWLFLVHRGDLLQQTADRFKLRTGEEAGIVGDGGFNPARFTVAMFQTLHAGLKAQNPNIIQLLSNTQGAIFDECHTLAADTFWTVAMNMKNAYFRVGLSGTPLQRGDRRSTLVVAALGPLIYKISAEYLIGIGVLSRPKIRFLSVPQRSDKPTWQGVYGDAIIRSKVRNLAVLSAVKRSARPCLVFVQQINHGKTLQKMFQKEGITCEFIWGKEPIAQRQAAVQRLVRTDIEVLIVNVIFQEGVDIPSLRSVVVATGGASAIAALQRVGRGMRAQAGKEEFEVWEIADRGCGCAELDRTEQHSGCRWLEKHTKKRIAAYKSEEYDIAIEEDGKTTELPASKTTTGSGRVAPIPQETT